MGCGRQAGASLGSYSWRNFTGSGLWGERRVRLLSDVWGSDPFAASAQRQGGDGGVSAVKRTALGPGRSWRPDSNTCPAFQAVAEKHRFHWKDIRDSSGKKCFTSEVANAPRSLGHLVFGGKEASRNPWAVTKGPQMGSSWNALSFSRSSGGREPEVRVLAGGSVEASVMGLRTAASWLRPHAAFPLGTRGWRERYRWNCPL